MSDYEKRYNVHENFVSHYTDDPAEALKWLRRDPEKGFCYEGYADAEDVVRGHSEYGGIEGTLYTRRTIGPVLASTLEFLAARTEVLALLSRLTGRTVEVARQR